MTETPAAPAPIADDAPIFGRNPHAPDARPIKTFALEVEVQRPAERGVPPRIERLVERFRTYTDLDGGAVLGLMNARGQMEQANRVAVLLGVTLDDLDGAPVAWVPPVEPEYDDEGNVLRADPEVDGEQGDPLYLFWDGSLVTRDELRLDELTEGSSRRRFSYIMDSPTHRVRIEALNEISEWLTEGVVARPTQAPTRSQHGPQRTRAGRAVK